MTNPKIHCLYDELVEPQVLKKKFDPKNRNIHSDAQIERLAKILNYQGYRYAVKISKQTGIIRSGHARVLAGILNNYSHIPVVYQDYESLDQEIADSIADNAIANWAELDLSGINLDLADLGPFDPDLLGIQNFNLDVNFEPGSLEEQGKLDEKKPVIVQCPNCAECFDANENKPKN